MQVLICKISGIEKTLFLKNIKSQINRKKIQNNFISHKKI